MELKKYKMSDIATIAMSNVDKKTKQEESQVKLCNFVDVYRNWAITKELVPTFMNASAKEQEIEKFTLHKGQVALTKDSETRDDIGIATYIADDMQNVLLGYHCAVITPNNNIVDSKYLNVFMHSNVAHKYFENNASGSGQRYTLSYETLLNIPVFLPSLDIQKEIGQIFSNLDRKITLNRQINGNLEAMARQLYDYWFVQFDFPDENGKPYKSSGGKMVWNEKLKRVIPERWTDTTLGRICNLYQPQTLGLNLLSDDEPFKVYGANGIVGHYKQYNHEHSEIAMACRGNSCGVLNRTMPKSWITGNAMVIHFKDESINNEYIKQALKYVNVKGVISGSGQPQLTRNNLEALKIIKPTQDILWLFSKLIAPIVEKELIIEEENDSLTKQRDGLLPLLMNGQVTVN